LKNIILVIAGWLIAWEAFSAENLLVNGEFDHPEDPLTGWVADYAWSKNQWYVANKDRVSVVSGEQGRRQVARLESTSDEGTKLECIPIPFESGYRYKCTLDIKGGEYRVYFAGYRWRPRTTPHEEPALDELRMIYKSKAETGTASGWRRLNLELPGTKMSPQALQHLQQVRYITLYVWMMRTGMIDNVSITRVKDSSMRF
jgi:hypothetical protein